ncbi:hypothetical protein FE257_003882 [Aspergillus nanangensis]|uniref:Nitronate monooxygenase domain-containing protein n=1 Tax=Aspergillus nanangensis TaxID=2582783 RepID=A0AAD4GNA2_ASPNN|nr:hypothetical protein FE257_003882 [Aspergillus nanangensis]
MLNIALPALAVSVSAAGGLGFLAAGFDVSSLEERLQETLSLVSQPNSGLHHIYQERGTLPIGVGFINWGADLPRAMAAIEKYKPCAVWLFAPRSQPDDLVPWVEQLRSRVPGYQPQIWVQVGLVAEAVAVAKVLRPDVLVVQGSDAGGHGLAQSASVLTLVPEVCDTLHAQQMGQIPILAAGGIVDGRGVTAALALGASGAVMGTRFLASLEANVAHGYQAEILRSTDGGTSTVRSTVYDRVRGIAGWPDRYNGRGVINQSYIDAVEKHMGDDENRALYEDELKKGDMGWGPHGRLTTYAGTAVGLVRETMSAADIVQGTSQEVSNIIGQLGQ